MVSRSGRLGLGLAIALMAQVVAGPAEAAYVFYHQTNGDWSTLCWRDDQTGQANCRFGAPPETLTENGQQNILLVHEYAADRFQIAVEVRDLVDPGAPLFLKVDDGTLHETTIENGFARWVGKDAMALLSELLNGVRVVYRVITAPDGLPRDTAVSLQGFGPSLAGYRGVIRDVGILPGAP